LHGLDVDGDLTTFPVAVKKQGMANGVLNRGERAD
jgi:hypothetical protein